jgi:hypothetical protein
MNHNEKVGSNLTIDILVPTSIYPDIWCTPGVVSHTPESATKRNDTSGLLGDVNRCTTGRWELPASTTGVACANKDPNAKTDTKVVNRNTMICSAMPRQSWVREVPHLLAPLFAFMYKVDTGAYEVASAHGKLGNEKKETTNAIWCR